ncbi:hypothetical protein IIC68_00930 [archaeon]|nr:hypothetical protein [archaeon]
MPRNKGGETGPIHRSDLAARTELARLTFFNRFIFPGNVTENQSIGRNLLRKTMKHLKKEWKAKMTPVQKLALYNFLCRDVSPERSANILNSEIQVLIDNPSVFGPFRQTVPVFFEKVMKSEDGNVPKLQIKVRKGVFTPNTK